MGPRHLQVVDDRGQPVPGARVRSGQGLWEADAQGLLSLPPPQEVEESLWVEAPGRLPSFLNGWLSGPLALTLLPAEPPVALGAGQTTFELQGRVLGTDGQPQAGATVVAANAAGAEGGPAVTDEAGRFRLRVRSPLGAGGMQLVLWAHLSREAGRAEALAHARWEGVVPEQVLPDLRLAGPQGTVRLAAPLAPPFAAEASWRLWAEDPTGPAIAFASPGLGRQEALAFWPPGCTVRFEAQAQGQGTVSVWRAALSSGPGPVVVAFLRPPEPQGPLPWVPGAEWAWRPIPEAQAYRLSWAGGEGASAWPRWRLPEGLGPEPAALRILATTEGPLRDLAAAGPRGLRRFEEPERWAAWWGALPR